jgi:hypothetical protein
VSFEPTPKQTLALWHLLITGEEPAMSEFAKKLLDAPNRRILERAGLIDLERREKLQSGRRKVYAQHIVLTDKAWEWATEHFEVELSKSQLAVPILQELIKKLGCYLKDYKIPLVEFLSQNNKLIEDSKTVVEIPSDIEFKIREAYLKASGGEYVVRVRLVQLRQLLADVPRELLDKTLIQMELAGRITLMHLDDPQEIHPEDEQSAVNISGHTNHIVYMSEW